MNLSTLLNKEEIGLAATVLDYQPFILSESIQRISRGLFQKSMKLMGFKSVVEIEYRNTWLPQFLPYSLNFNSPKTLEDELNTGSKHIAFLALR